MQQKSVEQQLAESNAEISRLREQNETLAMMVKRAAREMKAGGKDVLADLDNLLHPPEKKE